MRGNDGKLCFSEKAGGSIWKDYMERMMNEENYSDHYVEGDAVEGPLVCVIKCEVVQASNKLKTSKAHWLSDVSMELVAASGKVGIQMMIMSEFYMD